jgi:hypothetical protein
MSGGNGRYAFAKSIPTLGDLAPPPRRISRAKPATLAEGLSEVLAVLADYTAYAERNAELGNLEAANSDGGWRARAEALEVAARALGSIHKLKPTDQDKVRDLIVRLTKGEG